VDAKRGSGGRTFLEELSRELGSVSERISSYSELDALRRKGRARERITVSQLQAVQVARQSRSDAFGIDLANPGWSLLLELFRCYLEKRPVRLARLTENARVATTTALRWLDVLAERGLVERQPDPARQGASLLALTEAASDAMEDYFIAVQLAWDGTDAPFRREQSSD